MEFLDFATVTFPSLLLRQLYWQFLAYLLLKFLAFLLRAEELERIWNQNEKRKKNPPIKIKIIPKPSLIS
jgi:hypothetical protein